MTEIPCIKESCLKYPLCRHRIEIECNELQTYLLDMIKTKLLPLDDTSHYVYDQCYDKVQEILPKVFTIGGDHGVLVDIRHLNEMYKEDI